MSSANQRQETTAYRCTCGNNVNGKTKGIEAICDDDMSQTHLLDYSFIQLPTPLVEDRQGFHSVEHSGKESDGLYNHGLLKAEEDMKNLIKFTDACLDMESKTFGKACLSSDSVKRIAMSLDTNTERLKMEAQEYKAFVQDEKDKDKRANKALTINQEINGRSERVADDMPFMNHNLYSFQQEIENLRAACNEHESELKKLNDLLSEEVKLSETLSQQEDEILEDFNGLAIEAKAFQEIHKQLTIQCTSAERERYKLSHVRLPEALFKIDVDELGLRYPLINSLRLSYNSKGGVSWKEINAAWSQAAQLVMFVGSVINFISSNLKIVPLVSCAKIFEVREGKEKRIVHNLSIDFESMNNRQDSIARSLREFCALLQQVLEHVESKRSLIISGSGSEQVVTDPPYKMRGTFIGSFDLSHLKDDDDLAWNSVVHCIASNLKWLVHDGNLESF